MDISEQIENDIKTLKEKRFNDEKQQQYNLIASRIGRFLKNTNTKRFTKTLILSFFDAGYFPVTTQRRYIRNIINVMKYRGMIIDDNVKRISRQARVYELKSDDKKSYMDMMKSNGFTRITYYKWYCDSDGIPRRKKVGTSRINAFPVDKNGDSVEDWDESELNQTISRAKQGVKSFGSKSVAIEKRPYSVKGFLVC